MGIMDELKKIKNSQEEVKSEPTITERLDNVGKGVNPPLPKGGVEGRPLDPPIKRELPKKEKVEQKEKQACPTCGKGFVHLSRHKCDVVPMDVKPTKAPYEPPKAEEVDILDMAGEQLDTLGGSSFPREGMTDDQYMDRLMPIFYPTRWKEEQSKKSQLQKALDDLGKQEQERVKDTLETVHKEVTDYARGLGKNMFKEKKFPTFDIAVDVVPIKLEDVHPHYVKGVVFEKNEWSGVDIEKCILEMGIRNNSVLIFDSDDKGSMEILSFFIEYARNVFMGRK